jgi:hypothetical protein
MTSSSLERKEEAWTYLYEMAEGSARCKRMCDFYSEKNRALREG